MPYRVGLLALSLVLLLSACPEQKTEQETERPAGASTSPGNTMPTEAPNTTAESAFVGTGLTPGDIVQLQTAKGKLLLPRPLKIGYSFQSFKFDMNEGGGPGSGPQLDLLYTLPGGTELYYSCASSGVGSLPSNPDRPGTRVEHPTLGSFEIFALQDGGSAAYTQYEISNGGMDCHLSSSAPDYELLKQVLMSLQQVQ